MPRQVITRPSGGAVPYSIDLGAVDVVTPSAAFAHFNGTGASGSFLPCITYYTQDGLVFARAFPATAVAAGASADVSWFPGLSQAPSSGASSGLTISTARAFYTTGAVSVLNATRQQLNLSAGAHQDPHGLVTTSGSSLVIVQAGLYSLMHQTNFPTADINSTKAFKMELQTIQTVLDVDFDVRNSWSMSGPLPGTENPDSCQTLVLSMAAGDLIQSYYTHNFGSTISVRGTMFIAQLAT